MTNPTANRSYDMPQSTDLVTNLPADFATFGDAVDLDMVTDGGYATTATAAGTTTLTKTSARVQFFTGTTTQDVVLPVVSTLALGNRWRVVNKSTAIVTVKSSGSNTVYAIPAGATAIFVCILITGTSAASWSYDWAGATTAPSSAMVLISAQTITSATSISLTSILSATYDNYVVEIDIKGDSAGAQTCLLRFRSGSSDYSTSYNWNYVANNGNNVFSQNATNAGTSVELVGYNSTLGGSVHLMLRQLFKSSTYKRLTWESYDGDSQVARHGGATSSAVSGSYDGFTLIFTAATTGTVKVYGLVNS